MHFKTGNLIQGVSVGIIAHVCNNIGLYGAGFARQIAIQYPEAKKAFHLVPRRELGDVNFVRVANRIIIGNMVSLNGVHSDTNPYPLRLEFLEACLQKVQSLSIHLDLPVHMPLIGAGLTQEGWGSIRKLIERNCPSATVWELPTKKSTKTQDINIQSLFDEIC